MGGKDEYHRIFFRWGWNTLVRALFGYLATDVDCGFKLFKRSILSKISLPSDGAMIDTQLYAGARARGLKVVETPVTHLPRTAGQSTGGNPKVILKALKELVIYWWQLKNEIMVEQGKAVFKYEAILLAIILLVAGFMRIYKIADYMTFLGDEGRDAIVMRDIVLFNHFPAIGPGTSIGSMYLGPLYYYLMAPFMAAFNLSPVGPSVGVALFSLATIFLLWWICRQWVGRVPALFVSMAYALSPTVIIFSRSSWNPNVMPFFALLTMYAIWKVWRLGYWRWLVISAISFAFVLNSHYLGLLLLPTLGFFTILSVKKSQSNLQSAIRSVLVSVGLFSLLMSPLLIHDLRHNYQNINSIVKFFSERQTTVNFKPYKAVPNIWPIWKDINTSLLGSKTEAIGSSLAVFLIISSVLVLSKHRSKDLVFTLFWLVFGLIGLGLYKQHIYDHYYGFLFPIPFILFGFSLQYLFENKLLLPVAGLLLLIIFVPFINNSPLKLAPNFQLTRTEEVANSIKNKANNNPFNLALIAKSNYDASYRFFLIHNQSQVVPIRNPQTGNLQIAPQLFVVCEDTPCNPIGHPLAEIASFGWAKIEDLWEFPWGVKVYKLVSNPSGK
jgi:hypothetical protein